MGSQTLSRTIEEGCPQICTENAQKLKRKARIPAHLTPQKWRRIMVKKKNVQCFDAAVQTKSTLQYKGNLQDHFLIKQNNTVVNIIQCREPSVKSQHPPDILYDSQDCSSYPNLTNQGSPFLLNIKFLNPHTTYMLITSSNQFQAVIPFAQCAQNPLQSLIFYPFPNNTWYDDRGFQFHISENIYGTPVYAQICTPKLEAAVDNFLECFLGFQDEHDDAGHNTENDDKQDKNVGATKEEEIMAPNCELRPRVSYVPTGSSTAKKDTLLFNVPILYNTDFIPGMEVSLVNPTPNGCDKKMNLKPTFPPPVYVPGTYGCNGGGLVERLESGMRQRKKVTRLSQTRKRIYKRKMRLKSLEQRKKAASLSTKIITTTNSNYLNDEPLDGKVSSLFCEIDSMDLDPVVNDCGKSPHNPFIDVIETNERKVGRNALFLDKSCVVQGQCHDRRTTTGNRFIRRSSEDHQVDRELNTPVNFKEMSDIPMGPMSLPEPRESPTHKATSDGENADQSGVIQLNSGDSYSFLDGDTQQLDWDSLFAIT